MRKPVTSKKSSAEPSPVVEQEQSQSSMKSIFWLVKTGTAPKLGKHAEGGIGYQILSDEDRQNLFLTITANTGGGYFSRERVLFQKVQQCLDARAPEKPFPSKLFAGAFVGRSSNNAGFLAAILRAEGLLVAAPDSESQHLASSNWQAWQAALLAETGKRIEIDIGVPTGKQSARDCQTAPSSPEGDLPPLVADTADPQE